MGNTYEVSIYVKDSYAKYGYSYQNVYRGESYLKMLWVAWQQKRKGIGCVKMEWR